MAKKVLAIDPSMKALGWAMFHGTTVKKYGLLKGKTIKSAKRGGPTRKLRRTLAFWTQRTDDMVDQVLQLKFGIPDVVVIEMPKVYVRGSARAMAAKNSGAIEKLIFLVASLRSALVTAYAVDVVLVYPQTWKGQTDKRITQRRMTRRYGRKIMELDHNVVDAIGIGTWYREKYVG